MPKPAAPEVKKALSVLSPEELAELRALRKAQQEATQRVETLKMRLFQLSERNMDQTIALLRQWLER